MNAHGFGAGLFAGHLEWVDRLGWTLVHSLWQFALVALLFALASRGALVRSARRRYAAGLIALAALMLLPAATWMQSGDSTPSGPRPFVGAIGKKPVANGTEARQSDSEVEAASSDLSGEPALRETGSAQAELPAVPAPTLGTRWRQLLAWRPTLESWLSTIVYAWFAGVGIFALRPVLSWWTVERLRHRATTVPSQATRELFEQVAAKLKLRSPVRVLCSGLSRVPAVIGYFRPAVLIPLALATALPPSQLEAILAHELAHVRRHDYLVNLLQTAIETLFFYHPAVWWISHQVRCEREYCCDDIVLAVGGNQSDYAKALIALEELRSHLPATALAAGGGSLLQRVRRIAGVPSEPRVGLGALLSAAGLAGAVAVISFVGAGGTPAVGDQPTNPPVVAGPPQADVPKERVFRITLADGARFEVVGVGEHPTNGREWWRPDGSPLKDGPKQPALSRVNGGPLLICREFVVDVRHAAGTTVQTEVEGGGSSASTPSQTITGGQLRERDRLIMAFPRTVPTASVVFGYSGGPWTTVARDKGGWTSNAIGFPAGGVVFGEPVELRGGVQIPISYDLTPGEVRIVAVDRQGGEHAPTDWQCQSARRANLMTAKFRGLALADVTEFRVQSRPTRRIEFKNVALHRDANSKVEMFIDGKPYVPALSDLAPEAVGRGEATTAFEKISRLIRTNPFRAVLPDGSMIALLEVGSGPAEGNGSWQPDGSRSPFGRIDHTLPAEAWRLPLAQATVRSFLLHALPVGDGTFLATVNGTTSYAQPTRHVREGAVYERHHLVAGVSEKSSTTLRVRYFPKPWRTVSTTPAKSGGVGLNSRDFAEGRAAFADPVAKDGGTAVVVEYDVKGHQGRVVAVDRGNREHSPEIEAGDGHNLHQLQFQNLPPHEIQEFRFQVREYQTIEFRNVSLQPDQATKVEIYVDRKRFIPDEQRASG
jgi:beta-lactamase regulating signal transducer with metallopeptidase domain